MHTHGFGQKSVVRMRVVVRDHCAREGGREREETMWRNEGATYLIPPPESSLHR
jgi:hypothetical protein